MGASRTFPNGGIALRNNQKVTNSLTCDLARQAGSNLIVMLRVIYGAGFEEIQKQRQLAVVDGHGRGKRLAQVAHVHCPQEWFTTCKPATWRWRSRSL